MKQKFLNYYMSIAELTAELSYAQRLKVGAVIVRDQQILGTGYNGQPTGWDNRCEGDDGKTLDTVIHAESNSLMKVTKSTESTAGATMFCTHSPCLNCAKLIYQSGINTLYWRNQYRSDDGLQFLTKSGVNVMQLSPSTQHG